MGESTKVVAVKAVRNLPPHYSSCLLQDSVIAAEKLDGIRLAMCNPGRSDGEQQESCIPNRVPSPVPEPVHKLPEKLSVPDAMSCGCCQLTFVDRDEQMRHYKGDWHRYNIHRKLLNQPPVSEDKFEDIQGDVSSISGSDDDDEDRKNLLMDINEESTTSQPAEYFPVQDRKLHKVYFTNSNGELISVYRCLLHHKKDPPEDPAQLVKIAAELPSINKYAVLMISAGHFAAAVFRGKEILEHKTFHRYTVRAKRGTAQSSRDQKGNAPNSAGARLRRYNEEALSKDVQELLELWKDHLRTCNIIFVKIPVNNRAIFYGGKNPILKKDDNRIRIIPFTTRRPTFSEAKRVYQMITSIECYGQDVDIGTVAPLSPPRFYSKDTEQLEVREPRIRLSKKHKDGAKTSPESDSKPGSASSASSQQSKQEKEEESSGEEADVQLVESMETLDLTHLREFEVTKRKQKKKKKTNQKDADQGSKASEMDENNIRWRNKIFTCCKTGDVESLLSALADIQSVQSQLDTAAKGCTTAVNTGCTTAVDVGCTTTQSTPTAATGLTETSGDAMVSNKPSAGYPAPDFEPTGMPDCSTALETPPDCVPGVVDKVLDSPDTKVCQSAPVTDLLTSVLNSPVGDSKTTFLHLATRQSHAEIITTLLTHGADPAIKDGCGKLAYNIGQTEERNVYRRFMANFPTKYDYAKAQVPSPLTLEMETEKKIKMAEKRKQKKKAAQERNKDKKAAEAVLRAENEEKNRFIKLSDREKRALAAERRILQQHNQEGKSQPVLSRCFQCGQDMTGKVPFEYSDNKFCTTRCLREHRAAPASGST